MKPDHALVLIAIPKSEIEKREKEWMRAEARKKRTRTP
jgi:hypothetical protein